MGKQSRSKALENLGKGKVTPVQVAFIVDRYLSDNNFSETRSVFRTEASSLISKSPVREAPKSLLSLGAILNEYISLKEQKVMVEQEKAGLEQEKCRVQSLLQGMQTVLNTFNASANAPLPLVSHANATKPILITPHSNPTTGHALYSTPTIIPASGPKNYTVEGNNYSSPVTNEPLTRNKRSSESGIEAPTATKRSRTKLTSRRSTAQGRDDPPESANGMDNNIAAQLTSSAPNRAADEATTHVSGVAKCLFNQPQTQSSPPTKSSCPKTLPQADSPGSHISTTPVGGSSYVNCSHSNTPTNCSVISTKRVTVSPLKQMTIERNHCTSSCSPVKACSKRVHVKRRLDFDGSDDAEKPIMDQTSTSESEMNADLFDLDLPDLDAFGENFSFTELLVDLDLGCE
ncbi:hypothetical protein like AT2G37960 [Hibiscus trionum]|uniref:LisH domain-containing protein n=1 Tax=Hibiscus trionum TaxID=183268 RepID=A0A9W7J8S4_HIBTR|nr:hypothetical protein like AT2G37960 [Hibiscus trionum]